MERREVISLLYSHNPLFRSMAYIKRGEKNEKDF